MRSALLTISFLLPALACASHAPESLGIESDEPEADAVEPLVTRPASEPSPSPEPEPLACLPEGGVPALPAMPALHEQPGHGACWTIPSKLRRRLTREVEKQWDPSVDGATVDVSFACDRLADIDEIVYEGGAGHGGSLELARLRRDGEGGDWDVLLIRRDRGSFMSGGRPPLPTVARGRLPAASVSEALDTARAAVALQLEERVPADASGASGYFSSADVYEFVRVVDTGGHARSRSFVGYLSGDAQAESIPAGHAGDAIAELLDNATLVGVDVDDDSRTFFMQRYVDAHGSLFGDEYTWWVRERMIELAGEHAGPALIPTLAEQLCLHDEDASDARSRALAIGSIMQLGGQEGAPTTDDRGGVTDALAGRWQVACGTTCSGSE